MSKYETVWYKLYNKIASLPSKISWRKQGKLTAADKEEIAKHFASGYYIVLTGSTSHLSSVIVSLLSWIKTGVWARYSHVLINCDNITDANDTGSFKFMEATATGVHYSTFDEIFNCDHVCLLTPNSVSNEEWTKIIDGLLKQKGKKYDDLFDLADSTRVSCVEVVLNALKAADYENDFKDLERLIIEEGNLVPQMYRQSQDFKVTYER
jgi:MinD-like ATPase involved in chromosome partitioning or flagellar assembly